MFGKVFIVHVFTVHVVVEKILHSNYLFSIPSHCFRDMRFNGNFARICYYIDLIFSVLVYMLYRLDFFSILIVPTLFKGGSKDPSSPNSYRGISLSSAIRFLRGSIFSPGYSL